MPGCHQRLLLQVIKALDVVLGVTGGAQQLFVVDDAVSLDDVCDTGNGVAVFQGKGVTGQLAVELAVGQVQAVIFPVCQTHRAVDLEQGRSLALLHLAHQGSLILAGSGGHDGDRHAGLLGVLSGQILPILILLGLEVQVVDLTGSAGSSSGAGSAGRSGRGSSGGAAGRAAAGSQTQSSSGNTGGFQEVTTRDHLFHNYSPSSLLKNYEVLFSLPPTGSGRKSKEILERVAAGADAFALLQLGLQGDGLGWGPVLDLIDQKLDALERDLLAGLDDGGHDRDTVAGHRDPVKADDGDVLRHPEPGADQRPDGTKRDDIAHGKQGGKLGPVPTGCSWRGRRIQNRSWRGRRAGHQR